MFRLLCSNWTYAKGTRIPNNLLGALLRKFWPGFYTVVPGGDRNLDLQCEDYEVADAGSLGKASDAMITKIWVRQISRVSFIVDHHTVLTYDSHNFFYA